jgi:hypothetical protein
MLNKEIGETALTLGTQSKHDPVLHTFISRGQAQHVI